MQEKLNLVTNFKKNNRAQGTIEYLVIIGIIIIIGLVTVSMSTNFLDSGSQINNTTGNIKSTLGQGGISITEAITDSDGDAILTLKNNTSEKMTLTSITPLDASGNAGTTERYDKVIHYGETINFSYPTNTSCVCSSTETTKTCYYEIELTSAQGLIKKERITINVNCTNNTTTDQNTQPLDTIAPTIELSSPETDTNTSSKTISFTFTASDNSQINSCTLQAGNDSNTYNSINNGTETTIQYTFTNDILTDWNISCTDGRNTTTSTTRTIDIDSNQYQITTCLELQEMNLNLEGDYELMNNIDCSMTRQWNNEAGFEPIGEYINEDPVYEFNPFKGTLNGNNKQISELYIKRTTKNNGLFGCLYEGEVSNLGLVDVNIGNTSYNGAIAGLMYHSTITNSYSTGFIQGAWSGGLIGVGGGELSWEGGSGNNSIYNSYSNADVNGGLFYGSSSIGGLVGLQSGTFIISQSYATGDLTGTGAFIGGIIGSAWYAQINNSYFTGRITTSGTFQGGSYIGGIIGIGSNTNITNSYSTGEINGTGNFKWGIGGGGGGNSPGTISNSYWDINTSGITSSSYGTGKTTPEMKQQSTFTDAGWDFDTIWTMPKNDYPILAWQTE